MTEPAAAATMCEAFQATAARCPQQVTLRSVDGAVKEVIMNPIRAIRRSAGTLAWLASVLLASAVTAPAALASPLRPDPPWWLTHRALPVHLPPVRPDFSKHPPLPHHAHVHAALAGGMPGWQITLITVGAAVLAAAAILLGPALAARRHPTTADSRVTGARDRWHSAHPAAAVPAPTRRPD